MLCGVPAGATKYLGMFGPMSIQSAGLRHRTSLCRVSLLLLPVPGLHHTLWRPSVHMLSLGEVITKRNSLKESKYTYDCKLPYLSV